MENHCNCCIIVASTFEGIIGINNKIPWHYPEDMKRFKRLTVGKTVIMGRNTWNSIPEKFRPLPNRRNIVITSHPISGECDCFDSIPNALKTCTGTVWFIGGARIYEEALLHANYVDMTIVPDYIKTNTLAKQVYFPTISLNKEWLLQETRRHPNDNRLFIRTYIKNQ